MSFDQILSAEKFKQDPRIKQAKELLFATLKEHSQNINAVRPPLPDLKISYDHLIQEFGKVRGNKLFFPYIGSGLGNGPFVELLDGSVKFDFITGIGPQVLGHSSLDLLETNIDAALIDVIMQGNLQQNKEAFELCQLLAESAKLDHCFLTTTGVMANENALKIAFQKNAPANRIIAFEHCFLGRSLAASQVTDKAAYREGLPLNYQIDYIPFYDNQNHEESINTAVDTLKKLIKRYPKQHAVMIFELVQGEGGFNAGSKEFFLSLIPLLKDNGIAVFIDEVQTFGRTSELFAYQHFGLDPFVDIVSIGKLSQVCATLFTKAYSPRSGLLSQTFIGSTAAIIAGKTIIQKLLSENFFGPDGKNMQLNKHVAQLLSEISSRNPLLVKGPFGLGAMIAFTVFDGNSIRVNDFVQKLFTAGVMSFIAGSDPTRVRFLLPFANITLKDINQAMEIVEATLLECQRAYDANKGL